MNTRRYEIVVRYDHREISDRITSVELSDKDTGIILCHHSGVALPLSLVVRGVFSVMADMVFGLAERDKP